MRLKSIIFGAALFFLCRPSLLVAATLDIAILDNQTGSAPFDSGACDSAKPATSHVSGSSYKPGEDVCAEDRVVRTGDVIIYSWDYSVIGSQASNVTIKQVLPAEMKWLELPPQCKASSSSSISADLRTITCNVGSVVAGTTQRITPRALVSASAANGKILETSATISADASASKISNTVKNIASAFPKYDLENKAGTSSALLVLGKDGVSLGQVVMSLIGVSYKGKGSEPVNSAGFHFTHDIDYLTTAAITNKATLYTWGKNGVLGACGKLYDVLPIDDINDRTIDSRLPMGGFDIFPKRNYDLNNPVGLRIRSVADSGVVSCAQASPGGSIDIKITGTDSGTDHRPTYPAQGAAKIPEGVNYVVGMWVKTWVPLSDASAAGGRLKIESKFSLIDPVSVSGQSNFGTSTEPSQNNRFEQIVSNVPAYLGRKSYSASPRSEGLVLPGQISSSTVTTEFQGEGEITDIVYCDKIDNTKNIVDIGKDKGGVNLYSIDNPLNLSLPWRYEGPYSIDYGVGGKNGTGFTWASASDQATFECDDANGPWYSDRATVPGGAAAITKVRLKIPKLTRIHKTQGLRVFLKFLDFPAGTTVANFGSIKVNEILGGAWQHETKVVPSTVATPGALVGNYSDRITYNLVDVRIKKETVPFDANKRILGVLSGTEATFKLTPSLRTTLTREITSSIIIEDVLPPLLSYVTGSASVAPSKVELQLDGSTKITWQISGLKVNATIPPITYRALVNEYTPNLTTLDTCADISSPDDAGRNDRTFPCGDGRRIKSAGASIFVTNPSSFTVSKLLKNTVLSPLEDLEMEIKYRNTSSFNITQTDVIDVLPFNGDGIGLGGDGKVNTFDDFRRTPPSQFHGKILFKGIKGSNGENLSLFECGAGLYKYRSQSQ